MSPRALAAFQAASASARDILLRWMPRAAYRLPEVALLCLAVYFHLVLSSHFRSGQFEWHDVTMISDWLTNAIYRGRPFYMSHREAFHLGYNFTPSLILLAPLFGLFESQYLVLLLNVASVGCAAWLAMLVFRQLSAELLPNWLSGIWGACLVIICFENRFTKTVLLSGHFEIYYALPASLALFAVLRTKASTVRRTLAILLLAAIAAGVRQDAGLYIAMHAMGLVLLPGVPRTRARVLLCTMMAAFGVLSVILSVSVFMPMFGDSGGLRFWRHLGSGPLEIAMRLLTEPKVIYDAIMFSGMRNLNQSFGYLHLLTPFTVFANLPAFPLYLIGISDVGRRTLGLYNSSFALPGFYFATAFGLYAVAYYIRRWLPALRTVVLIMCTLYLSDLTHGLIRDRQKVYSFDPEFAATAFQIVDGDILTRLRAVLKQTEVECPQPQTVASDSNTSVLLPNSYRKLLPSRATEADLVVFWLHARTRETLPVLPDEKFRRLAVDQSFRVYCRRAGTRARPHDTKATGD